MGAWTWFLIGFGVGIVVIVIIRLIFHKDPTAAPRRQKST
jgi:hypothetical protein